MSMMPSGARSDADWTVLTPRRSWSQRVPSLKLSPMPRPSCRGMLTMTPSPTCSMVCMARCSCSRQSQVWSWKTCPVSQPESVRTTRRSRLVKTGLKVFSSMPAFTSTEYFSHSSSMRKSYCQNVPCAVSRGPTPRRSTT